MIRYSRKGEAGPQEVLLFGSGLIGSEVDAALLRQRCWQRSTQSWYWSNEARRKSDAIKLVKNFGRVERIDVIWSAGISGFASCDLQMDHETTCLAEIAQVASALADRCGSVYFHLISSLGALFEGHSAIDKYSTPYARRPYGRAKLQQEELIQELSDRIIPKIYRPSSVYGGAKHGRRGLFTAIMAAVIQQRTLTIYGSAQTLRDYVFARDIGTYIANRINDDNAQPVNEILASGRPTSISEAISNVETQLSRRLYFRFATAPHNSLDMTVRPSSIPQMLPRTSLSIGIACVHQAVYRGMNT